MKSIQVDERETTKPVRLARYAVEALFFGRNVKRRQVT